MSMRSYWCEKAYGIKPGEIAPWKLPRGKHATISVITHKQNDFTAVDEYLSDCEQRFKIDYIKRICGSTEQAWQATKLKLNAQFNKLNGMLFWNVCNLEATKSSGTTSPMKMKSKLIFSSVIPMP